MERLQNTEKLQVILVTSPEAAKARSDLKTPNHFNFSSFFGDFCLNVYGKEVSDYLS